ncbi:MAG: DNA mismatch repair protein MutS [Rhizobiales bacterium]|nr:DNA mismatch repair protein MutS [Hyphomicrobiales bacterium]
MMQQYHEIKALNPGYLLFYRMGDFYEMFFADAEIAAAALGIALTRRGRHQGEDIPMCGVPVHAADGYLQRLIRLGHRVAVCEQMEDPAIAKKRGSKSVVRRDVVRLVTPGTLTEDSLLEARQNNYLAALARVKGDGDLALAWVDISSGEIAAMSSGPERLAADIARLAPSEIILPDTLCADRAVSEALRQSGAVTTPLPASRFDSSAGERRLTEHFAVASIDAYGDFNRAEIAALGALLDYILLTQVGRAPTMRPPRREAANTAMLIDAATRNNLELTRSLSGEKRGSLLDAVDLTVTAAGGRLMADRLANPLADPRLINARLDEVSYLVEAGDLRQRLRAALRSLPDSARALARLSVGRGGPRDLGALSAALAGAIEIAAILRGHGPSLAYPEGLAQTLADLDTAPEALATHLRDALQEELPLLARDGGFVRHGYSQDLDDNRALRDDTRKIIAGLQSDYSASTGIKSLKLKHNNVIGYFIEVSTQNAAVLQSPRHAGDFIHRQTVADAMRFTTLELSSLEQRIAAAAERALAIEQDIFAKLCAEVEAASLRISQVASALARLDVAAALAELAETRRYVRPQVDHSRDFAIKNGRHPMVEQALAQGGDAAFIANDCDLTGEGRTIWLLTGPNMAGKSTFLRQNALIAVLAQMGSFVPASAARIGVVDRLFSRVGAADDLARGRSTFMVEMVETAAILNQASERSFVILDEIGRGTATFDGLSIAWATVEHLHDVNRCRALFATHYHELTALAGRLPHLANATVKVREWNNEVIFLHEVVAGVADRSYGIQVAKLAGLPPAVVARARQVLDLLEKSEHSATRQALADDLPLFSAMRPESGARPAAGSKAEERLGQVLPDELTPREALALIYELKALTGKTT